MSATALAKSTLFAFIKSPPTLQPQSKNHPEQNVIQNKCGLGISHSWSTENMHLKAKIDAYFIAIPTELAGNPTNTYIRFFFFPRLFCGLMHCKLTYIHPALSKGGELNAFYPARITGFHQIFFFSWTVPTYFILLCINLLFFYFQNTWMSIFNKNPG